MRRTTYILQAASVAALGFCIGSGNAAPAADQAWPAKWPSSLDGNTRVQADLVKTDYTPEEKRNIMTVLNELSDEARAAWLKDPKRAPHEGFRGLDTLYGPHGYDEATSISDRKDRMVDLIAKGNRVFGAFKITGHHDGTMYGFKADGKPLEVLEFFYRTFDADGHTTENIIYGEELELYVALGGKLQFSKDGVAAQIAAAPPPPAAAPAGPPRRAPKETWATWPPAQWPDYVVKPEVKKMLSEMKWTDEEKRALQNSIDVDPLVRSNPANYNPDITKRGPGRRGFDFIEDQAGFRGYNVALSVPDRHNELDDIIAKGNRVWTVFTGHGHQAGYFFGFPGDGHAIVWREMGFGGGPAAANGLGVRAEELQLYTAMGGKLQFPGKP